jgi:hypothetical protein
MPSWSFGQAYTFNTSRVHMLSLREKLLRTGFPNARSARKRLSTLWLGSSDASYRLWACLHYASDEVNRITPLVTDRGVIKLSYREKPLRRRDALLYPFPTRQYSYHTQLGVAPPSAMSPEGAPSTAGFGGSGWRSDCMDARHRGAELTVSLRGRAWQGQTNLRAVHEHQHGSGLPAQREGTEAALDKMAGSRATLCPRALGVRCPRVISVRGPHPSESSSAW